MNRSEFMIDTVRVKVDWPLLDDLEEDDAEAPQMADEYWSVSQKIAKAALACRNEKVEITESFQAKHEILKIRAFGHGKTITSIEAELPRFIHGDNGKLIKSQEELDEALERLESAFYGFADTSSGFIDFRRVDLSLHFECEDPAAIIAAHRHCRYPRTNGEKRREYSPSSHSWDYSGRRFALYDKGRQVISRYCNGLETTSTILRVEIQLRKQALKKVLGDGDNFPTHLDFDECYEAFRSELLKFAPPREITNSPESKHEALAMMDASGIMVNGKTPSELFTENMTAQTKRTWRRKIAQSRTDSVGFDWSEKLPEDTPPPFIDY